MACFGHLCVEAHITESTEDPRQAALTIVENLPIYIEMTSNTGIVTGRKSQQKRIRRLLRMMAHYAPGNLAAWEEAWKRWKYMTPAMVRPHEETKDETPDTNKKGAQAWHDKLRTNRQTVNVTNRTDGLDDDKSSEWQNYAGFLASLGGICLMADASPTSPASPGPRSFNDPSPAPPPPSAHQLRRISSPSESAIMVDRFVMEMVDLLLCDNVIVREWVMDILGTDLSPALYPIMFRHLETVLARCFGSDGDPLCSPRYTLFVEQAISVLKLVLDRMEETVDSLFTVDFGGLIDQYAKYLNKLGSGQLALKMKIRFCHLCEVLMAKKDRINIRQEFKLRNKLLEIIVEWTSDFSLVRRKREGDELLT
jgi:neurofibromin 1